MKPRGDSVKPTDQVTAYHEAGHFVAALFLHSVGHCKAGFRFREGQIYDLSDPTIVKFEKSMMVSLAGYEAQRKFRPSSVRSHHGAGDRKKVAEFVFRMAAPNEAPLLIKLLTVRTRNLIAVRWNEVERIAAALLERKWLSLEDGQRVIFGDELMDSMKAVAERTRNRAAKTTQK